MIVIMELYSLREIKIPEGTVQTPLLREKNQNHIGFRNIFKIYKNEEFLKK
jgi:hypothetical protein